MSASTHVIGFKPPDETFQRYRKVWESCEAAGINPPDEVYDFFAGEAPDPAGVEFDIKVTEWRDDMKEGFELDVSDIPVGVTKIRFYNSY